MNLILSDENVKVVMINIFGGITRCDDVAMRFTRCIGTTDSKCANRSAFIRTNAKEGLEIL